MKKTVLLLFVLGFSLAATQLAHAAEKLLWDSWYVVKIARKIPYAYYNDRVQIKDGRISFQNQLWKKEEDFTNEEHLAAFSENDPELTPLYYNFHSIYRNYEMSIDGTTKAGKLNIKIRKANQDLLPISRTLEKGAIFETFFPLWLSRHLHEIKLEKDTVFKTILEDNVDASFLTIPGQVRLAVPDAFAAKTGTTKIQVLYRGNKVFWWVDAKGEVARIENPALEQEVDRVSKEVALRFLK